MQLSRSELLQAYRRMRTIRAFEERVHEEFAAGHIPGFVHLYGGEEASGVGFCMHLKDGDYIASTHRGHGHRIAKGCDVRGMMHEIFGRKDGLCGGKGGSMHIADLSRGMMGANGIVGGGPPLIRGPLHPEPRQDRGRGAGDPEGSLTKGASGATSVQRTLYSDDGGVVRVARILLGGHAMIDFKNVLGSVLQSGMLPPSASQRIGGATGMGRQQSGDIASVLSGMLGQAKQAAGDTKREAQAGNPAAIGGLGALAGAVLGGVRGSPARGALGGAALAVLGHIAMQALQKGMSGSSSAGAGTAGMTTAEAAAASASAAGYQPTATTAIDDNEHARILLRAMINAAKADGQIDGNEMNNILTKLDEAGADAEARDFVLAEMRRPLDIDGLAAAATTPELAASIYAASVMAIRVDTPAERTYLDQLAQRMNLAPAVRASLDASMGVGSSAA